SANTLAYMSASSVSSAIVYFTTRFWIAARSWSSEEADARAATAAAGASATAAASSAPSVGMNGREIMLPPWGECRPPSSTANVRASARRRQSSGKVGGRHAVRWAGAKEKRRHLRPAVSPRLQRLLRAASRERYALWAHLTVPA